MDLVNSILIGALNGDGYYSIHVSNTSEKSLMDEMLKMKLFKRAKRGPEPFRDRFKMTPKGIDVARKVEKLEEENDKKENPSVA